MRPIIMGEKKPIQALRAKVGTIHWVSPALMYSSFIVAIILSILHHVFYVNLNEKTALDGAIQQWVQRSGTAIAFSVKLLFATATGTAYTQWFWFRLSRTPTTLKQTDILYGITFQPAWFFNIREWSKDLPLAFMASVTW
jgi:isoprenylcysteine carboxyl methyltransferase (ICMT) family protein YpbQ